MDWENIIAAICVFAVMGGAIGALLAVASKVFAVPRNERAEQIAEVLPGANCGGCGFSGCAALAEAIAEGKAKPTACAVGGSECAAAISEIMGVSAEETVRMRAQVMCSGYTDTAKKKFEYNGVSDCNAAMQLGGGSRLCSFACLGLGSCASACGFGAISVRNGVAYVEPALCRACDACVTACPKGIIKLIPYDATVWVACSSQDKGAETRKQCDVGCIGCKLCEKACESGAVTVNGALASIDYSKCTGCGKCAEKCPRKIIVSKGGRVAVQ